MELFMALWHEAAVTSVGFFLDDILGRSDGNWHCIFLHSSSAVWCSFRFSCIMG